MDFQAVAIGLVTRYGFQVLGAAIVLVAGLIVGRWLGGVVDQRLQGRAMEPPMRVLLVRVLRIVVMLFAVLIALDQVGFQVAPLVAGLGVAGIGLGFALQGVLSNMVAGLTIIFTKPFRVGDYVAIAGVSGEVLEITLASTILGQADLSRVVLPNRKIVGETLHNYGKIRQLVIEVPIAYDADIEDAIDTARAVLRANPRVLRDPAPGVAVARLRDIGVTLGVVSWVAVGDLGPAGGELNQALLTALRNRKILRSLAAPVPA